MDKFDQKIVAMLVDNARTPVSQIAREVNLSRSATAERISNLEKQGVISGYHARLGHAQQAAPIAAHLELRYKEHNCEAYAEIMRGIPEVKRCQAISGDVDMLLYIEVASMARLEEIRLQLEQMDKMVMVRTHMVLRDMFSR
ncbi:Lrp/AsnC family transcriptional regulator [Agarivorans sp. 1_MG-2023]|uniref:Lrp/AsnC family transcriptional regulator n=1 Tax=Agarivorans sp. 1_MG-2023 TaxID=3062634 RepID=UPI0026E43BC8|nr:Lrp/AsnC family transcriptional regulator [Agarivorans sp. 1_MG-2023]MDO6764970.1 Lrp/AsnC family transcriptional regulator [Agarivorans sp. 1_MG-2023]